jgi:hypothetical protein
MAPILKARRGFKFTVPELEHLLETVDDVIPIGNPDWERIWQEHTAHYPTKERTAELLKLKFQELACKKVPTGDLNCPPYIRDAKQIFYKIVQAADGLTGGSDVDFGEAGTERGDKGDEEDDDNEFNNDGEVSSSPPPQPSFHVWTATMAETIPSLPTLPLEVGVVWILLPLKVGVDWILHRKRGLGGGNLRRRAWGEGRKRVAPLHSHSRPLESHKITTTVRTTASCLRI